ncbi:ATP-binding protein [Shimia sp.]|uniref:ATP-binding protein n=1 Tax=Shimia sp. TaxID=1954381 RepID=UPI00329700D0
MNSISPIHIELEGTPKEVRRALLTLRNRLADGQKEAVNAGILEIVLGEVLNNVVEHALTGRKDGRIALTCDHSEQCWSVLVRDNGMPMPDHNLPSGIAPEVDLALEDLPEGGFGWSMVRMLARNIQYQRSKGWNSLSFQIVG